jgi:Leucine-rich repeat (LRR) protein
MAPTFVFFIFEISMSIVRSVFYTVVRVAVSCCVLVVVALMVFAAALPSAVHAQTTYTVPEAAEANKLYTSTNGSGWKNKSGWPLQEMYKDSLLLVNGMSFASSGTARLIQTLNLSINQLSGSIPNLNLPNLQSLDLYQNQLNASILNFTLPNVQRLNLSFNQLSGNIPNFNLPSLQSLDLGCNQLSGSIPNFNLPNLQVLSLGCNQLSGSILNLNLPNVQWLDLGCNRLSGNIPNFNLPNLRVLGLSQNQLSGSIPNFNLPNLQGLELYNNQLSGSIPNFNLPNLRVLGLSNNQLSGTIPNFNLPSLRTLYLYDNQLNGSIPNFNLPNLQSLELYNNQLSGSIANFNLPNLLVLDFGGNQLSGSISNFNLPKLQRLSLDRNQLSGSNVDWSKMPQLARLWLHNNKLVFRNLEPAAKAMQGKEFRYSPQDSVVTLKSGDTLRVDVGGERTQYQWFRNGQSITSATQAFYITADTALYSCRATNSLLPALTLYSRPVKGGRAMVVSGIAEEMEILSSSLVIHPQPFAGQATIQYLLTKRVSVHITVYSTLGQRVLTVFDGEQREGAHSQALDMSSFGIGVYLVRVQAGEQVQTALVHLVR